MRMLIVFHRDLPVLRTAPVVGDDNALHTVFVGQNRIFDTLYSLDHDWQTTRLSNPAQVIPLEGSGKPRADRPSNSHTLSRVDCSA